MRYPDGEEVQTGYDWQTGLATSLRQYDVSNPGQNKFVDYISNGTTYNEAGQITQVIYGNGRTANYTYDDGYRLSAMTTLSDDLPDFSYDYDGNSNIWRIYEQMNGLNQYQQFTYDSLNRLRVAYTRNGNNAYDFDQAGAYYQSTAYDALGNITGKADYKDRNYTYNRYGYGQANGILTGEMQHIHAVTHLNNTEMFKYDANGNMTTRNADGKTWTQTWTVENMLKRATDGTDDVQFFYDADGQMVLRQESGNRKTVNLGDGLYQRTYVGNDPAGALEVHKRYAFNGQAIAERQNNSVFFTLNDHLGGAVSNFGASWGTTQTRRDAWGKERYRNGTIRSNYAFTGQRWDERLGLYDYNARYYDPSLNRFLSSDTIVPDPTDPQSLNRYSYVNNNPLKYSDPSGHCAEPIPVNDPIEHEQNAEIYECQRIRGEIYDIYGVSATGVWELFEMIVLQLTLGDMASGLGGASIVKAVFQHTTVIRVDDESSGIVTDPFFIRVGDAFFNRIYNDGRQEYLGQDASRFRMLHEFAHILDARGGFAFSTGLERHTGGRTVTKIGGRECGVVLELAGACNYQAVGNTVSGYAKTSRREDWAESFAAAMFGGNWSNVASARIHGGATGEYVTEARANLAVDRKEYVREVADALESKYR